jgi:hypothetical protein
VSGGVIRTIDGNGTQGFVNVLLELATMRIEDDLLLHEPAWQLALQVRPELL